MKRKFRITIEGKTYEVKVEEEAEVSESTKKAPASAEATIPAKPSPSPAIRPPTVQAREEVVTSPMLGTILSVNVRVGDSVKAGDILGVLESMKMENQIRSPRDGKVKEILVAEGKNVRRREPLIVIGS